MVPLMPSFLRTLLLALLLPALIVPDGITVCLHRLAGMTPPSACDSCCGEAKVEDSTPGPGAPLPEVVGATAEECCKSGCESCCVVVPDTEPSKRSHDEIAAPALVATHAPSFELPEARPVALRRESTAVRSFHRATISLPLRL